MPKMNKTDQRRGGFYWLDKIPYVSVTQVLSIIDKPQLRYWFGKQVYYAMVKDPTLKEQEALSAPYKTTEKAAERGTTVHSIVESYKHTKKHIDGIPDKYRGYAHAFYSWVEDNQAELLEHERTVVSKQHGFAGTLDLLAKLGDKIFVIDIKTGKDIYPEAFLQLSAYQYALAEEGTVTDGTGVCLLMENGSYKFAEGRQELKPFLAAKALWEWKNKEQMEIFKVYRKGGDLNGR